MRVVLIDSSAVLSRCFHGYPARPALYGKKGHGLDLAAIYGYVEYVRTLDREFTFERLIHVLDPEGGSHHRLQLYPQYKANRPAGDPVLTAQKLLLPQVLSAFGQRVVQRRGVEADDLLGTLARRYADAGHTVAIISPDKDLMQLVDDASIHVVHRVEQADRLSKAHAFVGEEGVMKKLGVRPNQVADYLALVGDSVDNIPGVFDVGGSTAAGWLNEYGDLATLMTHAQERNAKGGWLLSGKRGDNLRAALPLLPMYRQLTTIQQDLDVDLEALEVAPVIEATVHAQWRELLKIPDTWSERLFENEGNEGVTYGGTSLPPTPVAAAPQPPVYDTPAAPLSPVAPPPAAAPTTPFAPDDFALGENDPFRTDPELAAIEEAFDATPTPAAPAPTPSVAAPSPSGQPELRVRLRGP